MDNSNIATAAAIAGSKLADTSVTSAKLVEAFFRGRYQSITTNSAPTGLTVQYGWSFVAGNGSSRSVTKTITFPAAFSDVPIVFVTDIGAKGSSDPTGPGDTSATGTQTTRTGIEDTTATNFIAVVSRSSADGADPGVLPTASRYMFSWVAIGTV